MQLGFSLGVNALQGGVGFSPAALFAGGEAGAWYDPSDMTTLFQDSIGTIPVTTAADPVGLALDKSQGLTGLATMYRGLDLTPTYWIDAVGGNDANAGTSEGAAWKTLSKIKTASVSSGQTIVVRVKAGTYSSATDDARVQLTSQINVTFYVVFEPGCVIDGTAYTTATQNGISYGTSGSGGVSNVCYYYGNGCTIQNVTTTDGNGIDGYSFGTAHYHDFVINNCRDGISMHTEVTAYFYDITVTNCLKWAVAHTGSGVTYHYRCSFADESNTATLGGLHTSNTTGTAYYEDCVFLPGTTGASRTIAVNNGDATFFRCRLGTVARRVDLSPFSNGSATVTDSYLNVGYDGILDPLTVSRCYGKFSVRSGFRVGSSFTMENCVLSGPATGLTGIVYSNYNPGSSSPFYFRNNIFETATAAAFMSVDAANAGYLVAAGTQFYNNILSGSAAFDADYVTADVGSVTRVANVTADALIGAANTLNPDDYGYASGSPAIGAGTGGTNSGFAVGAVAGMTARQVRGPSGIPGNHATQTSGTLRPLYQTDRIDFDGVDDFLRTVFPDLGTDATVAYANPGVGAVILTAQTIGAGNYDANTDHNGLIIIDRALTAAETTAVTAYLDEKAGV